MNSILNFPEPQPDWGQIRPLLDEAMHTLDPEDREAVLLRHFERCSYADIGARLGLNENTARMRVDRALGKLHAMLAKRGVTSTALVLAGLLTANAVGIAPVQLATKVARTAIAASAAGGASVFIAKVLALSKAQLATGAIAIAAAAAVIISAQRSQHVRVEATSPTALRASTNVSKAMAAASNAVLSQTPADEAATGSQRLDGPVLHLEVVAKESGRPIAGASIQYRAFSGDGFQGQKQLRANRFGVCDIRYPSNTTELQLVTQIEGLADTRLLWNLPNGDVIPTNYVVKLDPAVPIGGRVVDPDGNPIAGAKVGWSQEQGAITTKRPPESHDFTGVQAITDQDGRWQIDRLAEEMIPKLWGYASDSNFVGSPAVFSGHDRKVEEQLRDGSHVFQLGHAVIAHGIVVDAAGEPISDAKVTVGIVDMSGSRTGKTAGDGTFTIAGCGPGKQVVSAEANDFAVTTVNTELTDESEPIRITLRPGKNLRFKIVDKNGNPIPDAYIGYNDMESDPGKPTPIQARVELNSDRDGRAVWTNAPDGEFDFSFCAAGFMRLDDVKITADDQEHVITLKPGLIVSGTVRDSSTGGLIPRFQMLEGYPQQSPMDGKTNPTWSTIDRYRHSYANGTFHEQFDEPVILASENAGYILKFTADGYAPFVSRVIGAEEGTVQLDVSLRPAKEVMVTVYKPDAQLAVRADVGLVQALSQLRLFYGGISHANLQSAGTLLATDGNGQFKLEPDDSIQRVIVYTPDGYAEGTPAELLANPVMHLQPLGRLEVLCSPATNSAEAREYEIEFGGGSMQTVTFDYDISQFKPDSNGRIVVDKLPPGNHKLARLYVTITSPTSKSWSTGEQTPFEIRSGETTTLDLGALEHTVTARFQWPAGMLQQPQWHIGGSVHTLPLIPLVVRTNRTELQTYIQTPEFRAAQEKAHSYGAEVIGDGQLLAKEVQPGNYTFTVVAWELTGTNTMPKQIAMGEVPIIVPAGQVSNPIDAGVIPLQPVQ